MPRKTLEERARMIASLSPQPEEFTTVSRTAAIRFLVFAQGTGDALTCTAEARVMEQYLAVGLAIAEREVEKAWPDPVELTAFVLFNWKWARGTFVGTAASPRKVRQVLAGMIACRIACQEVTKLRAINDLPRETILERLGDWIAALEAEQSEADAFKPEPAPSVLQVYPGAEPRTFQETPLETPYPYVVPVDANPEDFVDDPFQDE